MIYNTNYERDNKAADIIKAVKLSLPKVEVKIVDGEQTFINKDKHFVFVDPVKKWVANQDDITVIISQLSA